MNGPTETPQEAARRLAASAIHDGYRPEALHEYTYPDGGVWYWRIRLKNPNTGKKWIRPMRLNGAGFELSEPAFPDGKPLYRLHDLAARPHDGVIVVEGEWKADALAKVGALTTTSGAADSAGKADWRPMAGRCATIWPDNDEAGRRYAQETTEQLLAQGCTVRVIHVEKLGLPKKGDAVDWLAANPAATAADIAALPAVEATNARARETNEQAVARLASMKPMDYDRARQAEADALGVRVTTLDAEVEKAREAMDPSGGASIHRVRRSRAVAGQS
jgi:putative DNA primase/helicase